MYLFTIDWDGLFPSYTKKDKGARDYRDWHLTILYWYDICKIKADLRYVTSLQCNWHVNSAHFYVQSSLSGTSYILVLQSSQLNIKTVYKVANYSSKEIKSIHFCLYRKEVIVRVDIGVLAGGFIATKIHSMDNSLPFYIIKQTGMDYVYKVIKVMLILLLIYREIVISPPLLASFKRKDDPTPKSWTNMLPPIWLYRCHGI